MLIINSSGNRDWGLILRMTLVLGLSIIATVVFGAVLTLVLVLLTNTDLQFGLQLAAIVVGLLVCAQFLMSGSIEQRFSVSEIESNDERLTAVAQRIAQQIDVPVPEIEIEQSEVANAYTIGVRPRNTRIVVTSGLVESLTTDELEAVIAHEFAHVVNRDGAVLTISAIGTLLAGVAASMLKFYGDEVDSDTGGENQNLGRLVFPITLLFIFFHKLFFLFWFVGAIIVTKLARYRELVADRAAAQITGNPVAVVSALEKLSETENRRPTVDIRHQHDHIQEFCVIPNRVENNIDSAFTTQSYHPRDSAFLTEHRRLRALIETHPSIEDRISNLKKIATND